MPYRLVEQSRFARAETTPELKSSMQSLRIIYAGTPAFAVPALEQLLDGQHEVLAVLTQPDRPAGRGRKLQSSPVKQTALAHNIQVLQPLSLRDADIQKQLQALQADLMVVTAYGLLLPEAVLNLPRFGCWNIHASLLPRWRGAAPIQRAIEAGDQVTGITIMQMDKGLDTGDMLLQRELIIKPQDTSASLHDALADIGAEALQTCITALAEGNPLQPVEQDHEQATYAHRLNKAEAQIDWSEPAEVIARKVRAFNPWPVSWCHLLDKRTRIWKARAVAGEFGQAGRFQQIDQHLIATCGEGGLAIESLQMEGSRVMSSRDWLNAHGNKL